MRPKTTHAEAFARELAAMAKSIRREARGRRCGDCQWFGPSCERVTEIDLHVNIVGPDAVACRAWKGKVAA